MKNISVFCGAHNGNNSRYAEDARKMAGSCSKRNKCCLWWQCWPMKIVSDAALDKGWIYWNWTWSLP